VEDVIIPIAGMATTVVLLLPVVLAGVRYFERRTRVSARAGDLEKLSEDVRVLQDRLDAVEIGSERLEELEERLDFAERMLARQREAPQIRGES
jgi:hypothetical protein